MKNRIMEQARQEIYKAGFRFTMADIAKHCGISTKTVYESCVSKEALILDMVQQAIEEIKTQEQNILEDQQLHTMDKLKALLMMLPRDFQFFDIKRLYELQRYYPRIWGVLNTFLEEQWDGVARIVAEGQREGLVERFDSQIFIQMYVGGLTRLMEQASVTRTKLTLQDALNEMVGILIHGILRR